MRIIANIRNIGLLFVLTLVLLCPRRLPDKSPEADVQKKMCTELSFRL